MQLPPDIAERLIEDFGPDRGPVIARRLAGAEPPPREPDRVLRCAVFLAAGDEKKLDHNLAVAQQDYRDLIYWAEYDTSERRVRNFNLPFGREEGNWEP